MTVHPRRIVSALLVAVALVGCATAPRPAATPRAERASPPAPELESVPGRVPTPAEQRAIDELERVAERIRNLRFERPVPFRVQSREVITQFVRDQIEAEELERARVFYVALGLIAPDLDVGALLVNVLGEQIVGYYDPERSLMVIRDDVAAQLGRSSGRRGELDEAEMVIVHELVHALQDQRLGLGRQYEEERDIDADNAFASLVEGDATLAMFGHMAARSGQPLHRLTRNVGVLRSLLREAPPSAQGQELEQAPPVVRIPLLSRYVDGMVFCATLHGERGWEGVDGAHARPPRSTEQVLHPERYLAGEEPVRIELPAMPELEQAGWTAHDEDTLGELELGIYFGMAPGAPERDATAAEGWGGDRLRVYRNAEGGTSVVWFMVWDDEREAREAETAARAVAAAAPSSPARMPRVERIGRALLVLRDLPESQHAPVREAFARFASPYAR